MLWMTAAALSWKRSLLLRLLLRKKKICKIY
jgi:hypothetical protein